MNTKKKLIETTFIVTADKEGGKAHKWFNKIADGDLIWRKGEVHICDKGQYVTFWLWSRTHHLDELSKMTQYS